MLSVANIYDKCLRIFALVVVFALNMLHVAKAHISIYGNFHTTFFDSFILYIKNLYMLGSPRSNLGKGLGFVWKSFSNLRRSPKSKNRKEDNFNDDITNNSNDIRNSFNKYTLSKQDSYSDNPKYDNSMFTGKNSYASLNAILNGQLPYEYENYESPLTLNYRAKKGKKLSLSDSLENIMESIDQEEPIVTSFLIYPIFLYNHPNTILFLGKHF